MSRLHYEIVDVFTSRPFAGNQLAVVFGADELSTGQLQALAREFNYSETVFALPPTLPGADYRARIFTPFRELPFAGHPSVGVAVTQWRRGLVKAGELVQECGAGLLPVIVDESGCATLTGGTPTLGRPFDPAELAGSLGLRAEDLAGTPPRRAGCGLEFDYLQVRREALSRATPSATAHASVFWWEPAEHTAHVRVFAGSSGVAEDPATGSAALGLGLYLVINGLLPAEGTSSYTVHQGHHMGRPSRLDCTVTARGGVAAGATVAGQVVAIASGEIVVPPFVG